MISLQNISKSFSSYEVLKDISIDIDLGDRVAIIGQSGVGKSVLLKHMNGLLKPDSGKVIVDNFDFNTLSYNKKQSIRKMMSMVFQFGALFDSMTVRENILLALNHLTKLDKIEKEERIIEVLDKVGLQKVSDLFPHDISGGMRKRIGIARAIAIKPKYILYDEPTTGLDPITTDRICQLINNITKIEKNTSIIVTHEMKIVNEVSNKVVMLYKGGVIFEGNPDELNASKDKYVKYFISGKRV